MKQGDYIKAISGHFKGKRGQIVRVSGKMACVVWKSVWDHGIWSEIKDLKVTRKGKIK
jgi:ribosomal protein L24